MHGIASGRCGGHARWRRCARRCEHRCAIPPDQLDAGVRLWLRLFGTARQAQLAQQGSPYVRGPTQTHTSSFACGISVGGPDGGETPGLLLTGGGRTADVLRGSGAVRASPPAECTCLSAGASVRGMFWTVAGTPIAGRRSDSRPHAEPISACSAASASSSSESDSITRRQKRCKRGCRCHPQVSRRKGASCAYEVTGLRTVACIRSLPAEGPLVKQRAWPDARCAQG
jgi:hypothetical protein